MMRLKLFPLWIFVFSFFVLTAQAWGVQPLLQEGKKSVYQRVVTHPGAKLYSGAGAGAEIVKDPVTTFTAMYIYGREGDRLQVGASSDKIDGWIDKNMVTEWPQAITMLFTDRTGRDPVLFFKDHDTLEETCKLDDLPAVLAQYQKAMAANSQNLPPDYPVVASEPSASAVSEKNFYLLPVLSIDDQFYEDQGPRLMEVASINPGLPGANGRAGGADSDFRTGIVFVIDTTISMKPYIEQTLKLVRRLYDGLEKNPHADKVAFAVVAFRSNTDKTPGIEYTSKVICDFTTAKDRKKLEDALAKVQEASVSTHDVNEDSFAGIKEGVDNLSWQDYGSRVMMMVTDAGPLGAGDPTSSTGFSPESLADYLKDHKIYLTALHVLNPRTSPANKKYATDAYRTLTKQSDNQASYIALDATSPDRGAKAFNSAANVLADSYAEVVEATASGKLLPKPAIANSSNRKLTPEEEARRIAQSTGYAMQLQFLGNHQKAVAPQVVSAWITDADLKKLAENPNSAPVLAVEPAVLLTKGQLSNLYKQLKLLLESSEKAFLNGNVDLFDQISSAAAQMSRDPNQFSLHPDRNLAENGLLDEVLQDLPYKSSIGALTRKNWEDMSTGQRDAFIKRLKSLMARYEAYDKDSSHWESFGAENPNDWVYRVPLSMLP